MFFIIIIKYPKPLRRGVQKRKRSLYAIYTYTTATLLHLQEWNGWAFAFSREFFFRFNLLSSLRGLFEKYYT